MHNYFIQYLYVARSSVAAFNPEAYGDDPEMKQEEPKGCWGSFTNCIGGKLENSSEI